MPAIRPLMIMLRALGWAALPSWPAGAAAAMWWTGRAELLLLSVAGAGTSAAMTLAALGWAERQMAQRDERYDRLEARLCSTLVSNLPGARAAATTLPGLRLLPGGQPPAAPARR